jgi:hypothetical protein
MNAPRICECFTCKRNDAFRQHIERVPLGDQPFWNDIYDQLGNVELDHQVDEAILSGQWPTAREQLTSALAKCDAVDERESGR